MSRRGKARQERLTSVWSEALQQGQHLISEAANEVYKVEPVTLHEFVMSSEYLGQNLWGMSKAQREFLEHATDFENNTNFYVLYVGKGGGKNWTASVLYLYTIYKLLCMYDAHRYLDHNKAKAITFLNVAINARQAKDNFFDPMVKMLKDSGPKAFREFGFNPDTDILTSIVRFPQNIQIISANSKGGGIEGYDVFMALADEVDDDEFHTVDKVITTLRTSAQSRFRGKEKIMVISYRRYRGSSGKILEYYNAARGHSHIYARRYASWEFHPTLVREDFQTYFDETPEEANCVYGSSTDGSFEDSWIKDPYRIKNAMNWEREWILDWPLPYDPGEIGSESWVARESHDAWKSSPMSESQYRDDNGEIQELDPYDLPIREYGIPGAQYVFVGDPALGSTANGGDGYGICLAHREIVTDDEGNRYVRPVIDLAFRFTGRMFKEKQVQMIAVEKLITKLVEQYGYNIKVFSFDGWNSASLTQELSRRYRDSVVHSRAIVGYKEYSTLRMAIFGEAPPSSGRGSKEHNGGIDIPWHPIVYEELRMLREDRTKSTPKVDHPSNGSKDIADTIARAVHLLVHEWKVSDVSMGGVRNIPSSVLKSKVVNNVATEEEVAEYERVVNSEVVGMGGFKPPSPGFRLENILDVGR